MAFVVLRYHEVALKRGNRSHFESRLIDNLVSVSRGLPVGKIGHRHGRIVAELEDDAAWPELRERYAAVYGVANFSFAEELARNRVILDGVVDLAPLRDAALELVDGLTFESFRVETRRADKRFPIKSPVVNAFVGAAIKEHSGARVDLDHGELVVTIEILVDGFLLSAERVPGAGGLPVGTSGRVLALLSGGIDSPVAAARMMRRGCIVSFVHFHAAPYLDRSSQEKARELVSRLLVRQGRAVLTLVPFGDVQREIVSKVPPRPRVVLYRRMMMRIASEIARDARAVALVTGDSLGQVASQTLSNLAAVEDAADLPVLRPLLGMDKEEVVVEARRLGTYDVSTEPDQDCCSLFVPRHPATKTRISAIRATEEALDLTALVRDAIAGATIERYRFGHEGRFR